MDGHHYHPQHRWCLSIAEWPESDRRAWEEACAPADLLDRIEARRPADRWARVTRAKIEESWGRYLGFLRLHGMLDMGADPTERLRPETVQAYVEDLEATCAPDTVFTRISELQKFILAIRPDHPCGWLRGVLGKLRSRRQSDCASTVYDVTSYELFDWALDAAQAIHEDEDLDPVRRTIRFRNAITIGLLALRPLRRKNFVAIELGRHLLETEGGYTLAFEPEEMKNRRPLSFPVPARLVPVLQLWIEGYRRILLRDGSTSHLWLNHRGAPFHPKGFRGEIVKATSRAFGRAITPHEFRSIAATTIAAHDPEWTPIIAPILGHTNLRTAERYYIKGQQLDASRRVQRLLGTRRKEARSRRRSLRRETARTSGA